MPNEDILIPDPILDDRLEAERIAARLHRSIGNLTAEDADAIIAYGEALRDLIDAVGAINDPLLPELSSARPAEAHIMLLTEIERASSETLYRFNQLPNKVRIGLLRQQGVVLLAATAATTTLLFTKSEDYLDVEVTIPAGTEVTTDDFSLRVTTDTVLVIGSGTGSGSVTATAVDTGDIGRIPAYSFSLLTQALAGLESVTNTSALTGGSDGESEQQGEIRARNEFAIGEHLGSPTDWETWVYFELLRRQGRVTTFEGYLSNFSLGPLGYLLLVVQGADGLAPTQTTLNQIAALINARHVAGLSVSVRGPVYRQFDVEADVKIVRGQGAAALIAKATSNLQTFYNPLRYAYGPDRSERYIGLSDIVGQIEAASPQSISVLTEQNAFAVTIIIDSVRYNQDIKLSIGELPLLGTVTLTEK